MEKSALLRSDSVGARLSVVKYSLPAIKPPPGSVAVTAPRCRGWHRVRGGSGYGVGGCTRGLLSVAEANGDWCPSRSSKPVRRAILGGRVRFPSASAYAVALASADSPGPMPSHPPPPLRGSPGGFDSRPPPLLKSRPDQGFRPPDYARPKVRSGAATVRISLLPHKPDTRTPRGLDNKFDAFVSRPVMLCVAELDPAKPPSKSRYERWFWC